MAEDAKHVFAQHFLDVGGGVTAFQERLRNFGEIRGGVYALGEKVLSVEIGTEANVVYAGNLTNMIGMVD